MTFTPTFLSWTILISATVFTVLWLLDALTHKKVVDTDISEEELRTHRIMILVSSFMQLSLVLMYWFGKPMIVFFIPMLFTRTAHEFIDELKFHVDRCTAKETFIHLGMWLSIQINTACMFIWGYFSSFDGVLDLHPMLIGWAVLLFGVLTYTGVIEWNRKAG